MRILGFSRKRGKLNQDTFTTFRFPRRDKDWQVSEQVQVVFKPRGKEREVLGVAEIVDKKKKAAENLTNAEAQKDGFADCRDMERWMRKAYGEAKIWQPMNKLTLRWINRLNP